MGSYNTYLRSPAPGQKPTCDFANPTTGNYKAFIWQASLVGVALPTPDIAQPPYWGVAIKNSAKAGQALRHIYTASH